MKIESVNDLRKLLKLCREQGVDKIKVDNIEIELGSAPVVLKPITTTPPTQYTPGGVTDETKIQTDGLTEEGLLFYSVRSEQ